MFLDNRRAKEILQSSDVIRILYHGAPVWIQNVNLDDTVEVTYIDKNEKFQVPANMLEESNPLKWID